MLKYVFAFFAFILVSLAPVFADEGYIPYFPDFLEPQGIGFRGPSSTKAQICWADHNCSGEDLEKTVFAMPKGTNISTVRNYTRSSPVTLEYKKNYFFEKLFYSQSFADFGQIQTNAPLRYRDERINIHGGMTSHSFAFLMQFLTFQNLMQFLNLMELIYLMK